METIDTTKKLYKGGEDNIPRPVTHTMDIHSFLRHYQKEDFYKELLRHAQSRWELFLVH